MQAPRALQAQNQEPQVDHQPQRRSCRRSKDTPTSKELQATNLANTSAAVTGSVVSGSPELPHDPRPDASRGSTRMELDHSGGKSKASKREKRPKAEREDRKQQRSKRPKARTATPKTSAHALAENSLDQSIASLEKFAAVAPTSLTAASEQEGPGVASASEVLAEGLARGDGDGTASLSDPLPADDARAETTAGGGVQEFGSGARPQTEPGDAPLVAAGGSAGNSDGFEGTPPGGAGERRDESEVHTAEEAPGTSVNSERAGDDGSGSVGVHAPSASLPAEDAPEPADTSREHDAEDEADADATQKEPEETKMHERATDPPSTSPSAPSQPPGGYAGVTPKEEDATSASAAPGPLKPPRAPPSIPPPPAAPRSDAHGRLKVLIGSGRLDADLLFVDQANAQKRSQDRTNDLDSQMQVFHFVIVDATDSACTHLGRALDSCV